MGTAAVIVTLIGVEQLVDRRAVELGAGHDQARAVHRRAECQRPAVGVEQRHHRQNDVAGRKPEHVGHRGRERMQHVRAMRIDDALGISGRARRVAHAGGVVFGDLDPLEIAVDGGDPVFIGDRVLERGLRHVRLVGEDHVALDLRQLVGDLLQQRHEGKVHHHHAIFGVIDDVDDLVREQARIDGVIDRAGAKDAVPGLQMPPGVPGERADPVAFLDAVLHQALRDLERALANVRIGGLYDRSFDRARDNFPLAVLDRPVIDDPVANQRPVLHQAEHGTPPRNTPALGAPVVA